MKARPKIRKTVKWAGLVATVLLAVVWMGSARYSVSYWSRRGNNTYSLGAAAGSLSLGWMKGVVPRSPGWRLRSLDYRLRWPFVWHWQAGLRAIDLPLWFPTLALAVPTALAWRRDAIARRRERAHLCSKCCYDRRGLQVGAACPECGCAPSARS